MNQTPVTAPSRASVVILLVGTATAFVALLTVGFAVGLDAMMTMM
jgi:hypothetical protein